MKVLIIVEPRISLMEKSVRSLVQAAKVWKAEISLLVCGALAQEDCRCLSIIPGIKKIYITDAGQAVYHLAERVAATVESLDDNYEILLAASSTFGNNVLPRIAALWDVEQVSNVTKIIDEQTFQHPIYAGNALETVLVSGERKVLSIRLTAFVPVSGEQSPCPIILIQPVEDKFSVEFMELRQLKSVRPDLTQADIVVSGGRGLQSKEQFYLIEKLADKLGAAVGASRAAVDAGFISNDHQVGQTGKVVAPTLYIAVGISGAVQHLAGMKDSKIIVAINKDPDAQIFQIADYGLVGDLFKIIPEMIEKL